MRIEVKNTCINLRRDAVSDYGVLLFIREEVLRGRKYVHREWREDVIELRADSETELDRKICAYVERPGVTLTDDAWMPYELEAP